MNTKLTSTLAAALMMGVFSSAAQAVPGYCGANASYTDTATNPDTVISKTDVKINGNSADDCYGLGDNDSLTVMNALTWGSWGTAGDYFFLKDNIGSGTDTLTDTLGGYTFTLSDVGAGAWKLTLSPTTGLPTYLDLAVVVKASDAFAAYFFDNEPLFASNNGTYSLTIVNNGGQIAGLSHLSIYARQGDTPANGRIPEPGMLTLLGVGLLGQAWLLRRRRQQQK